MTVTIKVENPIVTLETLRAFVGSIPEGTWGRRRVEELSEALFHELNKPKVEEDRPIVVIATEKFLGEKYAESLGLENYIVVRTVSQMQGLRFRAMVVTPGYIDKAERARDEALSTYHRALMAEAVMSDVPRG